MADDAVLQEFIADMAPYIDAIEEAVQTARDFADANLEAKAAVDEMRDSSAETGLALDEERDKSLETAESLGHLRDEALEAAEAMGHLRDNALEAALGEKAAKDAGGSNGGGGLIGMLGGLQIGLLGAAIAAGVLATTFLMPFLANLTLATFGIGVFAAAAIPEISKVWTAISSGGAAMKKLSPAERELIEPIRDLKAEFHQLTKAIQPEILKAFAEGLKIIKDVMPALRPLIVAAGQAIDGFLGHIDSWLKSGSGQKFLQWMKTDGPHAVKTFMDSLFGFISALGRVFDFLYNFDETVYHVFDRVRHDVAAATAQTIGDIRNWAADIRSAVATALTWVEARLAPFTQFWDAHWTEIKDVATAIWDVIKTTVEVDVGIVVTIIKVALDLLKPIWAADWAIMRDTLETAWTVFKEIVSTTIHVILDIIAVVLDLITGHWSQAWADMKKLASDGMNGIESIIRTIASGFGSLLYDAGKALITGLISGIQSMVGTLGSVVGSIASKVAGFFGLSPAREGPLSGGGAPFIRGQHFGLDLVAGMRSVMPGIGAAAAALAGAAGAHLAAAPLAAGGLAGGDAGGHAAAAGGFTWTGNVIVQGSALASKQELYALFQQAGLDFWTRNRGTGLAPYGHGLR